MSPESSFDQLLNQVERSHQLACDPDAGGCGVLNYIHHILSTPPRVFTTGELRVVRKIHFRINSVLKLRIMYMLVLQF